VLLQLMANDLRSAYVKEPTAQLRQAAQQAKPQTISFIGEDHTEADQPADKPVLWAVLPTQRPDIPDTEMCHATYNIEPVNEPPQSRALFRRVNWGLDPEAADQERLFLPTELARGLDFRYCGGKPGRRA
jgi:hypothetical protein